jgi:hypothetical protein
MSSRPKNRHSPREWVFFISLSVVFAVAGLIARNGPAIIIAAVLFGVIANAFMAGLLYGRRLTEMGKAARFSFLKNPDDN